MAQRLRHGACGSARGAARLVADALSALARLRATGQPGSDANGWVLVRADSAFYGLPTIGAALRAGADVSVTVRLNQKVKAAIAAIGPDAWQPSQYTDAVFDERTGRWPPAEFGRCRRGSARIPAARSAAHGPLQNLLDAMPEVPALAHDAKLDLVAWNRLGQAPVARRGVGG